MERENEEKNKQKRASEVGFGSLDAGKGEFLCAVCTESIDEEKAYFDSCDLPLCAECLLELHKL